MDLFVTELFDFPEEHRQALVEELAPGVPVRIVRLAALLRLTAAAGQRRTWRTSRSFACCTGKAPMPDEADRTVARWAGSRRHQHQALQALPFREKLAVVEELSDLAAFFTERRNARGLPFRRPDRKLRGHMRQNLVTTVLAIGVVAAASAQQPAAPAGPTAAQMAAANNPLADMNALNFQNYYVPVFQDVADASANTMFLRGVMVAGRQLIRATLPFSSVPTGGGQVSGLGDFSIFDAIKLTGAGASTDIAVGPLIVVPTATDDVLGSGRWQAGAAAVAIHPLPGGSLIGALVTYQTDFAGDSSRAGTSLMAVQPILTLSMGGGYYFRSSGVAALDFENSRYLVPFGLGMGRVFRVGTVIANAFIEPQFTVYSKGGGQPALQLFMGLNLQKPKTRQGGP
jgi:hypothetical protein